MRWALGLTVLAALTCILSGQAGQSDLPPFLYTEAPRYEAEAWTHGGERFPDGAHIILAAAESRRDMAAGFFASADASTSYDGKRILFAARPSRSDRWQIWQTDLAAGTLKLLVTASDDCARPLYLPDGRITYTRTTRAGSTIEVTNPDAGPADVLTHAPGWFLTDDILRDGRILFEWGSELFTVYPDGTGVESLRCDHGPRRSGARQLSSGDVIFDVAGSLARFRPALAAQEQLGSSDLEIAGPAAEVSADRWLVAARPRAGGPCSIHLAGPSGVSRTVEAPRGLNAVEPAVVAERIVPREFPSGLVPTRATGNLLCLDAHESKTPIDGNVHSVRFLVRDASGNPQILGQTPIAADGSFYVEVPADQPIRMELLDAGGARLRAEEHWFWMRPSEQRICVGCHAGPERAPENRVPEILNQNLAPVKMLGDQGHSR